MKDERNKLLQQQHAEQERQILEYQKRTGHQRPVTRREFLSSGILNFSGVMVLPSVLNMMASVNPAYAAECPAAVQGAGLLPFVNINLAGGWSAVANWLPRDRGGQLLTSYSQLGSGRTPSTTTAFANDALFTQNSASAGFLAGVRDVASANTISRTAFVGIPSRSNDDTSNNPADIGGLLAKVGLAGSKLPNMGSRDTNTGVRQQAAFNVLPPAPLRVTRINDVLGALGFVGSLASLNGDQQVALAKTVQNLSASQARRLASMSGGENVSTLVECATSKNVENISQGSGDVDPRNNQALSNANIWNMNNNGELARAAMTMNALTGVAGAIGLELGGYDYHGNNRDATDQRDRTAGRLVGQVLQTAAVLSRPVVIYLSSDGSVRFQNSDNDGTNATGDSGDKGAVFLISFNPNGAPQARTSQLGGFTNGQSADNSFITGGNAQAAAAAVFANWAKLSGDMSMVQRAIPNFFSAAQLNEVVVF